MLYIEVDTSLIDHPKTRKLARLLGISSVTAVGHLIALWSWAAKYAPDGDLSDYLSEPDIIAEGAKWHDDPSQFVLALINSGIGPGNGFLDADSEDTLLIHDWADFFGKVIEKRRLDAERKRLEREKERLRQAREAESARMAQEMPDGVHPTSYGRPTDVTPKSTLNRTEHNRTEQSATEQSITEQNAASSDMPAEAEGLPADNDGGDAAGCSASLPAFTAEQHVARELVLRVAADFRGLDTFVRQHDARLIGYWALAAELDIEKLANPAGLIREMVRKGDWPNLPGSQIKVWQQAMRTNAWRNNKR